MPGLIILSMLLVHIDCRKTKPSTIPVLPAITQEGKNTFGCKVNGEVWIPYWPCSELGIGSVEMMYNTSSITSSYILPIYFGLSVLGKISKDGVFYIFLNIIGAGLACPASILLRYPPFIILEGAWAMVSLLALLKQLTKHKTI